MAGGSACIPPAGRISAKHATARAGPRELGKRAPRQVRRWPSEQDHIRLYTDINSPIVTADTQFAISRRNYTDDLKHRPPEAGDTPPVLEEIQFMAP